MDRDELMDAVRILRDGGRSPQEIARALGVRPAEVAGLARAIAPERDRAQPQEPVRCWVSPGWRNGLRVDRHPEWSDGGRAPKGGAGVAQVVIARPSRGRLAVCGYRYLVDTWCLGVKNAIGPRRMSERELAAFRDVFFKPWHSTGVPSPLELGRHLLLGAADYARAWLAPQTDFNRTRDALGPWQGPSAIQFGRQGKPCYVQGPYDDRDHVLRTLELSAGQATSTSQPQLTSATSSPMSRRPGPDTVSPVVCALGRRRALPPTTPSLASYGRARRATDRGLCSAGFVRQSRTPVASTRVVTSDVETLAWPDGSGRGTSLSFSSLGNGGAGAGHGIGAGSRDGAVRVGEGPAPVEAGGGSGPCCVGMGVKAVCAPGFRACGLLRRCPVRVSVAPSSSYVGSRSVVSDSRSSGSSVAFHQLRENRLSFQAMIASASPTRIRCIAMPNCGRLRLRPE